MNETRVIRLTNGGFTLVDVEDYERFNRFNWQRHPKGYVIRCVKRNKRPYTIRLHREILNAPKGVEVDHRNRNPQDNTRDNLRLATHGQNGANAKSQSRKQPTTFKGVVFRKRVGNWMARIGKRPRQYLGVFRTAIEAAAAYNAAAITRYGEFARLNNV